MSLSSEQPLSGRQVFAAAGLSAGASADLVLGLGLPKAGHVAFCPGVARPMRGSPIPVASSSDDPAPDIVFENAAAVREAIGDRIGILVCRANVTVCTNGDVHIRIDPASVRVTELPPENEIRFQDKRDLVEEEVERAMPALCA